jgi:hypothetical protein
MTLLRPVLFGLYQSVQVLSRDRHFVLVPVPVPLKDRKKRCILKKSKFI